MKIRSKFIGILLALSVIPIILISFSSFYVSKGALTKKSYEHLDTTVILKELEMKLWLNNLKEEFLYIISLTEKEMSNFEKGYDIEELESINHKHSVADSVVMDTFLKDVIENRHIFSDFDIIEVPSGKVVLSSDDSQIGKIVKKEPYFINGQQGLYIQNIYFSPSLGDLTLNIATTIYIPSHKTYWVISSHINLDTLEEIIAEVGGLGKTGETYLVNKFNQLVGKSRFFTDTEFITVDTVSANDCIKNKGNGRGQYLGYRDEPVIGVYYWLDDFDLCLISEIDGKEAFQSIDELRNYTMFVTFLIIVSIFIIGLFFSFRMSNPLKRLTNIAELISKGHLDKRIDKDIFESKDEVSILAKSLDNMATKLSQSLLDTKNIIETMPNALFILDKKGKIELVNIAASKLLGYKKDELKGKIFMQFLSKTEKTSLFDLSKIKLGKHIFELELFMKPGRGRQIPVSISGALLPSNRSKVETYVIVVRDIREFKKYAKQKVNEITPMLNRISLGDFSKKIELPDAQDEFSELIVAIDLMSDNLKELISENKKKTEQMRNTEAQLRKSHNILQKEKTNTDLEKAKIEAFLSDIGEGVIAIDYVGKIMFINNEAERLFGLSKDEVIGKLFTKVYNFKDEHEEEVSPNSYFMAKTIGLKKPVYITAYFVSKSGKRVPFSITISPIMFENKMLGVVGTFRDITKEKEVDKAKSEFVSLASHQLRTPLTGVKWLLQAVLKKGDLTRWQIDFIKDAVKSNNRMIALVNDLLNLSRIETGAIAMNPQHIDLIKFLNEIIRDIQLFAKKAGRKIVFKTDVKELDLEFDSDLISQVIINLLSNSVRYSNPKSEILVSIKKSKKYVDVSIQDKGIGIAKEDQKRLFTKFFRSVEATKLVTTGSGLGLYLVGKILEVCKATILVKSKVNVGSTFTVSIPIKPPPKKEGAKGLISWRVS